MTAAEVIAEEERLCDQLLVSKLGWTKREMDCFGGRKILYDNPQGETLLLSWNKTG